MDVSWFKEMSRANHISLWNLKLGAERSLAMGTDTEVTKRTRNQKEGGQVAAEAKVLDNYD